MPNERRENDTLGEVLVPDEHYWGAQTQRSIDNFRIGEQRMPIEIIRAFAYLKKAAALVNAELSNLPVTYAEAIAVACDDILEGRLADEFPLLVWQTGSGTQSNMNVNEVLANRATELLGGDFRVEKLVSANDDVNKSQSSNDTFPTAMHIATYDTVVVQMLPSVQMLRDTLAHKSTAFMAIVKTGRTHLMDATPLTLGQEFSGYVSQLDHGIKALQNTLDHLSELALGGTAVGTGINTPEGYAEKVAAYISEFTGLPFVSAKNKFEVANGIHW